MKNFPSYSGSDILPEKRQSVGIGNLSGMSRPAGPLPQNNGDTAQFRQASMTPPPTTQTTPAIPPLPAPVNILPFLGSSFERLAGMVASFFRKDRRDTVDEEFNDRWEQNEMAHPDLFAQNTKIQDTNGSSMGQSGSS